VVVRSTGQCTTVHQAVRAQRGKGLVAEVFRLYARDYLKRHKVTLEQFAVILDIVRCQTGELGATARFCPQCGFQEIHYCSCGNRHCPTCQASKRMQWVLSQQKRLLPVENFFVTFTVPEELRGFALQNPVQIYKLMFRSMSRTLKKLARDHLGATQGVLAVLHTWTQELTYHPHVHCVVTAGGLSEDKQSWIPTRPNFLFPVAEMKALYRKHMLQGLYRLYQQGKLQFHGQQKMFEEPWAFGRLVKKLWKKQWVIDVQSPRGNPEAAVKYLAAYTHRVAISDQRMVSVADGRVCFKTRDDKTLTLEADEFIRRFLLHVLPSGLHKMRPYGLYARSAKEDLKTARQLIAPLESEANTSAEGGPPSPEAETWEDVITARTGIDPRRCPHCGGRLTTIRLVGTVDAAPPGDTS
jgi:predicted Zn-ribbon and HTH transcriptional regulator